MRNAKGFSLVEAMVAIGLVSLVGFSLAVGIHQFRTLVAKSQVSQVVDRQINDIVENIRPNINLYQIDYSISETERLDALAIEKLPMAWDVGVMATAKSCPSCPGRYGYIIQPFSGLPGLYMLTVRMTHRSWEAFRDYTFVVTAK